MDSLVIVDCNTGHTVQRDLTAQENADIQQLRSSVQKAQQGRQAEEDAREAVLAQVAQKVGVPVDDLKLALRTGRSDDSKKRPQQ